MSTQALTLATPAERAVLINELQVKVATRLAARATSLVVEVMQNMPEYCINSWFRICDWDYENKSYTFQAAPDSEGAVRKNAPEVTVTTDELALTVPLMFLTILAGGLPGICVNDSNFWDACEWDADSLGCLLQFHFYGKVVFG